MKKHLYCLMGFLVVMPCAISAEENNAVDNIIKIFSSGGVLMWLMLLASVVGMTFALERYFALRKSQHIPRELKSHVLWLLENEDMLAVFDYLKNRNSTFSRVLRVILARVNFSREEIDKAVDDELARALWDERKNTRIVGIVATVAPLMGLLGTVVGMIDAFKQAAESGMDNPANFAGGIYQALYTTAFGLAIAIPFLIIYHFLRSRVEQVMRQVEDEAIGFVEQLQECRDVEAPSEYEAA